MFWYFLRHIFHHSFHIFFRGGKIDGVEKLRRKGPMFIAMNHPNAFMDPISLTAFLFHPRTYYMARGDAFKKGIAAFLLESMGIVPIYRLRDGGYENVKKNLESFKIAYKLLDRKQRIMVFAEGLSVQERRLRPIQKGTAKMSFGYLEQGGNKELSIVPVGINYSEPSKWRSYVYFRVGEPIAVKDYYDDYKAQPAHAILKLTREIEDRMKPLVPSLHHRENDLLAEQLQPILKNQFFLENQLSPADPASHDKYWEFAIRRLNLLTEKDAASMEKFRELVANYSDDLRKLKIKDHLLFKESRGAQSVSAAQMIVFILGYPVYLIGKILNYLPYFIARYIGEKKIKNIEFKAAFMFGVGAVLLDVLLLVEWLILWLLWHNWTILLAYTAIKATCGGLGLLYSPLRKKVLGSLRFSRLKRSHLTTVKSLLLQRKNIVDFFGPLT